MNPPERGRAQRSLFSKSLDPDRPAEPQRRVPADEQRLPYPTDLTDEQWQRVQAIIGAAGARRGRPADLREVLNAIHYRWRTGCSWRMLPHDFPPWTTVYAHFAQWQKDGTLTAIREALAARPRLRNAAPLEWWSH